MVAIGDSYLPSPFTSSFIILFSKSFYDFLECKIYYSEVGVILEMEEFDVLNSKSRFFKHNSLHSPFNMFFITFT